MKTFFYSIKDFECAPLLEANGHKHQLHFTNRMLTVDSATLAEGFEAVSIFAGDDGSAPVIEALHSIGIRYIALRAAGYDNVCLDTARSTGIAVANVPAYSPYAIAEHGVGLLMALNRHIILADKQVHEQNFRVDDLMGFDLHGKTVGIIGTGTIGSVAASILNGFGCKLLAYDISPDPTLSERYGMVYGSLDELCSGSDVIMIHTCLTADTKYLINKTNIALMKRGVVIINTARGAIINTADVIAGLEDGTIAALALDVYEHEKGVFFYDHSGKDLHDPMLSTLMSMPNVLITPHQAFATHEALKNIAETTIDNLDHWSLKAASPNEVQTVTIVQPASEM
jgi:D-lactate dehydrogenase